MTNAEVNFEMDERLWWQVRKHAQYQGMSIGEMTIKALGQYMLDHPVVLTAGQAPTTGTADDQPNAAAALAASTSLPRLAGESAPASETMATSRQEQISLNDHHEPAPA